MTTIIRENECLSMSGNIVGGLPLVGLDKHEQASNFEASVSDWYFLGYYPFGDP